MAGNPLLALSSLLCIFLAPELVVGKGGFRRKGLEEGTKSGGGSVVVAGNGTISSGNGTFELGFFSLDGGANWYLGIWYASIPIPTYVWVANRGSPVKGGSGSAVLTGDGRLSVTDSGGVSVWSSGNRRSAVAVALMETGNLLLLNGKGRRVWESFDFPTDTWLPEMRMTREKGITCWRSPSDPSPGNYSLRLKPPLYGEFELVFSGAVPYWSTGNWTGESFVAVPEMTVPYIYSFRFQNPFTTSAYFTYYAAATAAGGTRVLTRFAVDSTGVFRQFVWSSQTEHWDMFWARPESVCRVYDLCGAFGLCAAARGGVAPCDCPPGFAPADATAWRRGDYSSGCRREGDNACTTKDGFRELGAVVFTGAYSVDFPGTTRGSCEATCLKNCSCVGFSHARSSGFCRNFYGRIFNLRNLTSDAAGDPETQILHLRVAKYRNSGAEKRHQKGVLIACVAASSIAFVMAVLGLTLLRRKIVKGEKAGKNGDDEAALFAAMQLRVFSYKELQSATRGFSEKLGHGGFGTVFLGEIPGVGSRVAVKRLERPGGGGEREFRAEVCTIGSVQHVNLVRLRGFCCERAHRLLVYDYMPNGALSAFIGPSMREKPILSSHWSLIFPASWSGSDSASEYPSGRRNRGIWPDDGELKAGVIGSGSAEMEVI
ncbi:hypothetical protein H6P81_017222 [Aristolochia fimbriata]|uniref:Receptor-like serine/threonine-protein kinase n=1 Tax=Aristolochia fimbriata TaxID=158543 RepID=A0AAV7DXR1_ARIFI|nr:hypothetical protein H6P81_017222 [Aristolochia fimbriata]